MSALNRDMIETAGGISAPAHGMTESASVRIAATRGMACNMTATNGSAYQTMSRTLMYLRSSLDAVQLLPQQGWYVPQASNLETPVAAPITVRASIRQAQGMALIGQFLFGGNVAGTIDPATLTPSDVLAPGSRLLPGWYAVDQHIGWNTGAWQYRGDYPKLPGEGFASGTTTSDLTGTAGAGGLSAMGALNIPPLGLLGITRRRGGIILGDSLEFEGTTGLVDANGDVGLWARTVGGGMGYANYGISSTRANQINLANAPKRVAIATAYASDVMLGYGTNDVLAGATAATQLAQFVTIAGLFTGPRLWLRTIPPIVTGTTAALDGSDQTAHANAAIRDAVNLGIRAGIAGYHGYVDHSAVLEMPTNTQKWAPGRCADAVDPRVHPNAGSYRLAGATAYGRERAVA